MHSFSTAFLAKATASITVLGPVTTSPAANTFFSDVLPNSSTCSSPLWVTFAAPTLMTSEPGPWPMAMMTESAGTSNEFLKSSL